ncbi:CHAP domain-containing protein [Erythrobacter sp. SCSIO 43205]|uniref:CHAP domain-containing protein n=1 Tax=Erythrobacter sp. SCSIO 43205 TaxID=2779361 RepID=UPI001CA86434|nr:CHAP domain-containing protein [Erythrobacter sp. SCSIO 43205]UAB79046.1 CHAP domain-containing protein [Erythrobacter sp. SCSIO 43205]
MNCHLKPFVAAGIALASVSLVSAPAPLAAQSSSYLQCVPYARELSGVDIYGDARTWWDQADGKYARGRRPQEGAVMVFKPHRNMRLGHVAYVSKIVDSRKVLLTHANWSEINGRRGQIERSVPAIDVSPNNDWSEVRVWYHPIQGLGRTHWPLHGFIYADEMSQPQPAMPRVRGPVRVQPSREFVNAFARFSR